MDRLYCHEDRGPNRSTIARCQAAKLDAFANGVHFFTGVCSVPEAWPALIPLLQHKRLKPERYIGHHMKLGRRRGSLSPARTARE